MSTQLDEILSKRRFSLVNNINSLALSKIEQVLAIDLINKFISSATNQAAYGDSYSFFGRMREAGNKIPAEFETIDTTTILKSQDRRVQPYLRSQLFISLIAELEDFLNQILLLVLAAYPKKIKNHEIRLNKIFELGSFENIIQYSSEKEITKLFYASPKKYIEQVHNILSINMGTLDQNWKFYIEMKARRDIGLHNQWKQNDIYRKKVKEINGVVCNNAFLGIDNEYFSKSIKVAISIIETLNLECNKKFKNI